MRPPDASRDDALLNQAFDALMAEKRNSPATWIPAP
ncbi:hypothetical protein J2W20_003837 [Sinomonas atrocyanea]|jgi:hypothetical protein|nr:hypothetical protein [Sinomonas atrocyanea]MDR6623672.1 hypothetical protein [Sinomonas atrocyanea]